MSGPLRVGGRGRLADGSLVTWSVAEGARGRRWRASLTDADRLLVVLLLEADLDGRPTKLELSTPAGLLTAHPEPDGVVHGNTVAAGGIAPIRLSFGRELIVDVERLPIAAAPTCDRLSATIGVGEGIELDAIRIGLDLAVERTTVRFERRGIGEWSVDGVALALDGRGVPLLANGEEWPLEVEDAGGWPPASEA